MRIANRNFSPTLLAVVLTIAAVSLFVRLAFWQLSRAAEKDALQAKYAAGQRSVVELTEANAAQLTQYQRVSARGRYDSAHQTGTDLSSQHYAFSSWVAVVADWPHERPNLRSRTQHCQAGISDIAFR